MESQQFASQAQVRDGSTQKYRDEGHDMHDTRNAQNIMHDRRVVRGNTYAALVVPEAANPTASKAKDAQRRRIERANQSLGAGRRGSTPEPVPGRHHMDVQTDQYLEELTERVMEFEAETQTDFLLDRPATPLFMPAKIGVDAGTQIEQGELFDFDTECEPILEVLVGKTLERSFAEVLEEEELEGMRRHQEHFQQLREQEVVETQRMEGQEQRREDEKARRKEQLSAAKQLEEDVMKKILSKNLARSYLSGLEGRTFEILRDQQVFVDPQQLTIEGSFLSWLHSRVGEKLEQNNKAAELVKKAAVGSVAADSAAAKASVDSERKSKEDEENAAKRAKFEQTQENLRIKREEEARIAKEQGAARESFENDDYILNLGVTSFAHDEEADTWVCTLEDGDASCAVPDEMRDDLAKAVAEAEAAEPEEGQEKALVKVTVNKSKKAVTAIA